MLPNVTHSLPILLCCIIPSTFLTPSFPPSRPPQPQFSVSLINYSTLTPSSFLYLFFFLLIFFCFLRPHTTQRQYYFLFCFLSVPFPLLFSLLLFLQSDYTTTFFIFTPARPVSVIFWSLILFILLSSFFRIFSFVVTVYFYFN